MIVLHNQIQENLRASIHNSLQTVAPRCGTVINNRWYLTSCIGEGTYGTVYRAYDYQTNSFEAVKLENAKRKSKAKLLVETDVLKLLQGRTSQVARFIGCGIISDTRYLVMSLLGPDLDQILRNQPTGRFNDVDAARLIVKMLPAVKSVHDIGYVHRDIKPSNFAFNSINQSDILIFDFGAVRRYRDNDGNIIQPRNIVSFTGNPLYASTNALSGLDENLIPVGGEQSRRDDLWSLLYVIVMFFDGGLPWMFAQNWHSLIYAKRQTHRNTLLCGLRVELYQFYDYLTQLKYEDEPNYKFLQSLLDSILIACTADN